MQQLRSIERGGAPMMIARARVLCLTLVLAACAPAALRAGEVGEEPAGPGSAAGGKPTAVLLLVVTSPSDTTATFGQRAGDGGAAGAALAHQIEALGFRLRPAAGQAIAVSGEGADPLLPVGDQAAVDLARR